LWCFQIKLRLIWFAYCFHKWNLHKGDIVMLQRTWSVWCFHSPVSLLKMYCGINFQPSVETNSSADKMKSISSSVENLKKNIIYNFFILFQNKLYLCLSWMYCRSYILQRDKLEGNYQGKLILQKPGRRISNCEYSECPLLRWTRSSRSSSSKSFSKDSETCWLIPKRRCAYGPEQAQPLSLKEKLNW
jgi:hypothetical protein